MTDPECVCVGFRAAVDDFLVEYHKDSNNVPLYHWNVRKNLAFRGVIGVGGTYTFMFP